MSEYYAGKGCKCCAQSDNECCCEVDWTDPEVYKLRARVSKLEAELVLSHTAFNKAIETIGKQFSIVVNSEAKIAELEAELAQLTRENDNLRSKEWSNKFQPEEVIE
jgi:hypothetical protein